LKSDTGSKARLLGQTGEGELIMDGVGQSVGYAAGFLWQGSRRKAAQMKVTPAR